jgi:hypothetical protein
MLAVIRALAIKLGPPQECRHWSRNGITAFAANLVEYRKDKYVFAAILACLAAQLLKAEA